MQYYTLHIIYVAHKRWAWLPSYGYRPRSLPHRPRSLAEFTETGRDHSGRDHSAEITQAEITQAEITQAEITQAEITQAEITQAEFTAQVILVDDSSDDKHEKRDRY